MAKKPLRKGEGRVQLIACRDRINELSEAGYGPVMMFEFLTKEKRISMSYGGFYEAYRYGQVRKERRRGKVSDKKQPFDGFRENLEKVTLKQPRPSIGRGDDEYSDEELF